MESEDGERESTASQEANIRYRKRVQSSEEDEDAEEGRGRQLQSRRFSCEREGRHTDIMHARSVGRGEEERTRMLI